MTVGKGTRAVLEPHQHRGISFVFTPSKATGATLAEELPLPETGSKRVLYPASVKAADTIVDTLRSRGFFCSRINTYDTRGVTTLNERQLAAAMRADIVTIGSPTAGRSWVKIMGVEHAKTVPIAGIGHVTHRSLRNEFGLECVYPEFPGIEGWA